MLTYLSHLTQLIAVRLLFAVFRALPRSWAASVGSGIGQLAYFIGIRRSVTHENLRLAFPELPAAGIQSTSARVFRHFGAVGASFARVPALTLPNIDKWIFENESHVLDEALAEGRGCIVFSGHLGNWELMGANAAIKGYPATFVVTTQRNKRIEYLLDHYRWSAGIEIIKRRQAIRGVMTALKRNRLVALLIDQDAHEDGDFVPFFGRLASTPRGAAVFHKRTGAPLVFAYCTRLPGERYRIRYNRLETRPDESDSEITARMTRILENAVRQTPEQWFWMHRRWKTKPPES